MKILPLLLFSIVASRAAEPQFIFENRPEFGSPEGGRLREKAQENVGSRNHGALAKVLGDSLQTVTVRYFSHVWTDQKQVSDYLEGLVADPQTQTYAFQIWSEAVGEPEIECLLTFKDQRQGRLLVWGTEVCLRDGAGKWWFVSDYAHYHRKHPKGNRSLAPEIPGHKTPEQP